MVRVGGVKGWWGLGSGVVGSRRWWGSRGGGGQGVVGVEGESVVGSTRV